MANEVNVINKTLKIPFGSNHIASVCASASQMRANNAASYSELDQLLKHFLLIDPSQNKTK
jgi:hypothetical protein